MRAIIEQYIFKDVSTMAMVILFGLPILVFLLIGYSKLFKKCNERRWQAFIPFYNTYILGEIANVNWFYSLLANSLLIVEAVEFYEYEIVFYLISLLGRFVINYNIGKIFHKDYTYVILMTILPLPMYTILGFSKDKANLKTSLTKNGPIDSKTNLYDRQDIPEETISKDTSKEKVIKEKPSTTIKKEKTKSKTIKEIVKQRELTIEELNTYDIPIINMSFDKDSIPNSETKKEETITHQLNDDELLDIILKKKKERKPRPKTSPKNKKKKAVKRLKQRKKNK